MLRTSLGDFSRLHGCSADPVHRLILTGPHVDQHPLSIVSSHCFAYFRNPSSALAPLCSTLGAALDSRCSFYATEPNDPDHQDLSISSPTKHLHTNPTACSPTCDRIGARLLRRLHPIPNGYIPGNRPCMLMAMETMPTLYDRRMASAIHHLLFRLLRFRQLHSFRLHSTRPFSTVMKLRRMYGRTTVRGYSGRRWIHRLYIKTALLSSRHIDLQRPRGLVQRDEAHRTTRQKQIDTRASMLPTQMNHYLS
jgi:hypothetical protein